MNMKPIVAVAIALTVGIVTFSGVLIPAIESGVDTKDTFTNDGFYRMSYIDSDSNEEITLSWDHTKPTIITLNDDTEVDISLVNVESFSLVFSDDWVIRYLRQGTDTRAVQYYGTTGGDFLGASVTSATDMVISLSSGTATLTKIDGEQTTVKTATYDRVYYVDPEGYYSMKKPNESAYVNTESSIIVANGITGLSGVAYGIYFIGTVEDGLEFNTFAYYSEPIVSNVEIHSTDVSGYINLVNLQKVTFTLTNISDVSTNATYNYFLVPYEVTAEKSIHADATTILLFQTIPVFIVLGMIVAVVGVLYMKTRR